MANRGNETFLQSSTFAFLFLAIHRDYSHPPQPRITKLIEDDLIECDRIPLPRYQHNAHYHAEIRDSNKTLFLLNKDVGFMRPFRKSN